MLRNYFLIAYRNFLKQKSYTLINIFGLALGLTSAICIFLYVNDELSYDKNHPNYEHVYGVGVQVTDKDGNVQSYSVAPGGWGNRLKENLPEVESVTKVDWMGYPTTMMHKPTDKILLTEDIRFITKNFSEVLSLPLINGNPEKALEQPRSLLLSQSGAKRLFGSLDPINQIITIKHPFIDDGKEIDLVVTGIFSDYPANSHFKPSYIINIEALRSSFASRPNGFDGYFNSMGFNGGFFYTYVKLKPGSSLDNLHAELSRYKDETGKSDSTFQARGNKMGFLVTHLPDMHFDPLMDWEFDVKADKKYLTIFSVIAVMILLIACINYMNLATARSTKRAKEVGMRKALGGTRWELSRQFLQESALITFASLLVSILLVMLVLPYFNTLSNKSFTIGHLLNLNMAMIIIATVIFVTIVGGSYPAFFLSAFKPVEVLKGKFTKGKGPELFRKSLVAVQFATSMILVIATGVIVQQMDLIKKSKLNEKGGQILSIRYGGTAPDEKYQGFKNMVLSDPDIEQVTMANHLPRQEFFGFIGATYRFPEVGELEYQWNQLNVDFDFPKTYNLEFLAGRNFDSNSTADSSSYLLNESACKALNKKPEEVLGLSTEEVIRNGNRSGKIIGVVKDFSYRSMHKAIEPLVINPHLHEIDKIVYVQLPAGKIQEKIAFLEATWKKVIPGVGFDYWFLNEEFNRMYKTEQRISAMSQGFAVLAIIITILGLYGLASYTAEQKTKEVGIRKVLGATAPQVITMFLVSFFKIFFVATVIAIPIAWYLADNWLKEFVYRIPLGALTFIICVGVLMLITFLTVSYETYRAAVANPIKAIRTE